MPHILFSDYIRKAQLAVTLSGLYNIEKVARNDASLTSDQYTTLLSIIKSKETTLLCA